MPNEERNVLIPNQIDQPQIFVIPNPYQNGLNSTYNNDNSHQILNETNDH